MLRLRRPPSRSVRLLLCLLVLAAACALAAGSATARRHKHHRPAHHGSRFHVKFTRSAYGDTFRLPLKVEARRYSVLVMQSTSRNAHRLRADNHRLKVFMYQSILATRPTDPNGAATCVPWNTAIQHPGWFLLDLGGHRMGYSGYPGAYLMDLGSSSYIQTCLAHAVALARSKGFSGLFLDDVDAAARFVTGSSVPARYRSDASWQAATYALLSYFARNSPLPIIANVGGSTLTPGLWQRWCGLFAGCEEESWTDGGLGVAQQIPFWSAKAANVAWSEAHHKMTLLHSYNTTEAGNTFGIAAMLLVDKGRCSYSISNLDYRNGEAWYPEYATARRIGAPLRHYRRRAGIYRRSFSHGVVLLNPTAHTSRVISLGGVYSGTRLTRVRFVRLAPLSALILHRVG